MIELKSVVCEDIYEQETTIVFSRKENKASVYCSDNTMLTKIQKLLNTPDSEWELKGMDEDKEGNPTGYFFECPKNLISLRAKKKVGKEYTDEERAAFAERMQRALNKSSDADDNTEENDTDEDEI